MCKDRKTSSWSALALAVHLLIATTARAEECGPCDPDDPYQQTCPAPDPAFVAPDMRAIGDPTAMQGLEDFGPVLEPMPTSAREAFDPANVTARELVEAFDGGLWRRISKERAMLLLMAAQGRGETTELSAHGREPLDELVSGYVQVVCSDHNSEFLRRAHLAVSLAYEGKETEGLLLLRPYLALDGNDALLSPASEVSGWIHMRVGEFERARSLLARCRPTEKALYLQARCHMADGLYRQAEGFLAKMKERYPEGQLTRSLQGLREALNGMGIWQER